MASEASAPTCDVGLYGLAVMGQNFALNMASKGFRVAVCNRSPEKVDTTIERAKAEGDLPMEGHKVKPTAKGRGRTFTREEFLQAD